MTRLIAVAAVSMALSGAACADAPIDPARFQGIDRAARSVQLGLNTSAESPRIPELLEHFQNEIAALDGRTSGRREAAALDTYASAAESFRYLLRFQRLDRETVGGMVLLTGANRPIAARKTCRWRAAAVDGGSTEGWRCGRLLTRRKRNWTTRPGCWPGDRNR